MRTRPVAEWTMDELKEILKRVRLTRLAEEDCKVLDAVVETLGYLTHLAKDKRAAEIYQILGSAKSEKTRKILRLLQPETADAADGGNAETGPLADGSAGTAEPAQPAAPGETLGPENPPNGANGKKKLKGHGRNGARDYTGARRIPVPLESMKAGDRCPCGMGNLCGNGYGPLIRIVGQSPIHADIYELQKLRCNTCGEVFTAEPPAGVGPERYDATSASMVAVLKYGSGMPFYRLEQLQDNLGIPLPASTQWDIVDDSARRLQPAFDEVIRQAAQGEVLYNDDTSVKILQFLKQDKVQEDPDFPGRTGVFTSGVVSTSEGRKIALFFSGRKHAGENLAAVLAQRARDLAPPLQMCDALTRNLPRKFEVILGNCLTHGRRHFVKAAPNFPEECRYILEIFAKVYRNDAMAREQSMTPEARLAFHQAQSGPLMEQMQQWWTPQLDQRRCEPHSGLGSAIAYMQNHWTPLTLFLRVPGAPLDSNIVERALKKAILHRKNALFYKTPRGAHVGDLFMSLIYTCQLSNENPFAYLTALHQNADALASAPARWMPWNYRETLAAAATPNAAPP